MTKTLSADFTAFVRLNKAYEFVCVTLNDEVADEEKIIATLQDLAHAAALRVCKRPVRTALDVFEIGEVVRISLYDEDGKQHSCCDDMEDALHNAVRAIGEIEGIAA